MFKLFYFLYRLVRFFVKSKSKILNIIGIIIYPLYRVYCVLISVDIPISVSIGKGFYIAHMFGTVINENTVIGDNVFLRHCTTIGNNGKDNLCPIIGNNVNIGSNCCIIGNIKIGDNVIIGAGTVVVTDIPSNSVVVGNPGRVIKNI